MTTDIDDESDVLDGYLAGNFADADFAGLSDEQAAVQYLSRATLEWHRSVLRAGRAALAARRVDYRRIAEYANRGFTNEKQARKWLLGMIDTLQKAVDGLS